MNPPTATVNQFYVTPIPLPIRIAVFDRLTGNSTPYSEMRAPNNALDRFERTMVAGAYVQLQADLEATVQDYIAPAYRKLDIYATRLKPDQIHTLCAAATMSLGRSASSVLGERIEYPEWTVVRAFGVDGDATIDIEKFLRGVQNRLFEHYQQKYGFGA